MVDLQIDHLGSTVAQERKKVDLEIDPPIRAYPAKESARAPGIPSILGAIHAHQQLLGLGVFDADVQPAGLLLVRARS
ncbi:hypothetical protein [Labrys neptuniae]